MKRTAGALLALCLIWAGGLCAQDLASFEKRVTKRVLPNGLTVLIVERPEAPVFSFFTHVDAGTVQEVPGITGLAHMFEHMAFKGTKTIGTTNYAEEQKALERVEAAYAAYEAERLKRTGRDDKKLEQLRTVWEEAIKAADQYVVANEFGEIIDRSGGVGLNAFTSNDETGYFYSMPSNRLELWAYLESERFLEPVMREFYKERDVVREERRMRIESNPIGKLVEQILSAAFTAHPYGQAGIGWPSDLQAFSATEAEAFFKTYYVPANMVVSVVGDVKPAQIMPIIEKYFGRLPARPAPPPLRTTEPPQTAEKLIILRETAQPFYIEAYHKPAGTHPDDAVYEAISDVMSNGRTSRLYRSLVRDKKIAAAAAGFNNFPGDKYANLFAFYAVSTPGHSTDEIRDAIRAEIERIRTEPVSSEELQMVKRRAKANLIRGLDSNQGLALQLATAEARHGDWRQVFRQVEQIEKVTKEDILRVAKATFVPSNRTVGVIETQTPAAGASAKGDR